MPEIDPSLLLEIAKRSEWRAWLRKHHKTAEAVWLVFFKRHTGRPRIAYGRRRFWRRPDRRIWERRRQPALLNSQSSV